VLGEDPVFADGHEVLLRSNPRRAYTGRRGGGAGSYTPRVARTNTTDEFYIEASPQRVYEALTGGSMATWWPGARTTERDGALSVRAPGARRLTSPIAFEARVEGLRPGEGVTWWLDRGELRGRGEWWLESFKAGTIIHYYLDVERGDRGRARRMTSAIRRHRWAVRRGVNALKDRLEGRG